MLFKKILSCLLALVLCACMFGCGDQTPSVPDVTAPVNDDPIIPEVNRPTVSTVTYTPVYASAFGDTVILATVPMEEWHGLESDCPAREISNGGRIKCNGEHEREVPITKVLILEDLIPRVCSGWFRDMLYLEKVEGTEKLHTHAVTDMSHMFSGCERLTTVDFSSWDVSQVEDMTGMFDDCVALTQLPDWYES